MDRICIAFVATAATGTVLRLDAVAWEQQAQPMLTINASAAPYFGRSGLPEQRLLLDTGSSTLAFCDKSMATPLENYKTNFYSCNAYGDGDEGYWGPFYAGPIQLPTSNGGALHIASSHYSVMMDQIEMPCISTTALNAGVNGIFGVAFKQLDQATSTKPSGWSPVSVGECAEATTDFVQPLMKYLNDEGGVKQIGIYWSGKIGDGEGMLYLDDDATKNEHHKAKEAEALGKAFFGEFGWMDIRVDSLEVDGQNFAAPHCNAQENSPCIMDTGTPYLGVPYNVYEAMNQNAQQGDSTLTINLLPKESDAAPVRLDFDVATLIQNQWVYTSELFVLGLPLWSFYYTALDISDSSILFTPQQPSAGLVAV